MLSPQFCYFSIIAFCLGIILFGITLYYFYHTHKINQEVDEKNKELLEINKNLQKDYDNIIEETKKAQSSLREAQDTALKVAETQKELSQQAFSNYCEILNKQYEEEEAEYEQYKDSLETSYSALQLKLMQEYEECKAELNKIKSTREAVIEAQRRERELEDNISIYCIPISETDKADIAKLENLKPSLNKPRVLSMLIWQTWFQKPLKTLAAQIVGVDDKTGIYKITNIKTKECYIGQAVSIKDRWNEHAKCGLGIDTPAANKLYQSMQKYGLWNFAFELLEECPREELNEKEAYYIDLYNSCDLGMNSNKGIKK